MMCDHAVEPICRTSSLQLINEAQSDEFEKRHSSRTRERVVSISRSHI